MKSRKKSYDVSDLVVKYFHDNPGARVTKVAEKFEISVPYCYKLRNKAAGQPPDEFDDEDSSPSAEDRISNILKNRLSDYGSFASTARLSQNLKRILLEHATDHETLLSDVQQEALDMIATKMARIVNGDPDKVDNWDDISGYAKLVSDVLQEERDLF